MLFLKTSHVLGHIFLYELQPLKCWNSHMASVVTDGSWQTDKLQQQKQEWLLCHQRLKSGIHTHPFKNLNVIFYTSFIVILAVLRIILRSIFGLVVKNFFRRKALPFHLHIMECTCVTTCEADKPLWLEHLSNSYVIKTPDYFIILSVGKASGALYFPKYMFVANIFWILHM